MTAPGNGQLVALTGATGFIGTHLSVALVAAGYRVRALVRPVSASKPLARSVERIPGDLSDAGDLARLLENADTIIHCAGAVRGAREADFMRINKDATEVLVASAQAARVRRFILVSSLAARHPGVSPYAASKRAGEAALQRLAHGTSFVALRPPAVYGKGDRELMPLFATLNRGLAPVWGDPEARFSLIHVDDLVRAILSCVQCDPEFSSAYELHDGRPNGYSMNEVIAIVEQWAGRRIRRFPVPSRLLDLLAGMNLRCARAFGYSPMLTPWKLRELRHPRWVCDNKPFSAMTGWNPEITLAEGLPLVLGDNPDPDGSPIEDNDEHS